MDDKRLQRFLQIIRQIESSGGKNFNHPIIESGIHKGHRAMGNFALMPNTVKEIVNRMRLSGQVTPEIAQLNQLDPVKLKETIEKNPEIENKLAESLAQHVLSRQSDDEKAAFSWNQGHNLTPEKIAEKKYQQHDYVQKFNKYKNEMGEE